MSQPEARSRRAKGEPRRLLLIAAVELFNERGYDASTREIAEQAGVSETLLYRNFGSKAGLFREAMVQPFVVFVDGFVASYDGSALVDDDDALALTEVFVGGLYDMFTAHRGLVGAMWSAATHQGSTLAEIGVLEEVRTAVEKLVGLGRRARSGRPARNDIATRAIVSMVAGMAVADSAYGEGAVPDRDAVVTELAAIATYGRLGRDQNGAPKG